MLFFLDFPKFEYLGIVIISTLLNLIHYNTTSLVNFNYSIIHLLLIPRIKFEI
jgi:hypothetical protein